MRVEWREEEERGVVNTLASKGINRNSTHLTNSKTLLLFCKTKATHLFPFIIFLNIIVKVISGDVHKK